MASDDVAISFLNIIKNTASLDGFCYVLLFAFFLWHMHCRHATSCVFLFFFFTGGFTRVFSLHVWVGNPSASRLAPYVARHSLFLGMNAPISLQH